MVIPLVAGSMLILGFIVPDRKKFSDFVLQHMDR